LPGTHSLAYIESKPKPRIEAETSNQCFSFVDASASSMLRLRRCFGFVDASASSMLRLRYVSSQQELSAILSFRAEAG